MKPNVTDVNAGVERHRKGSDAPVRVHIKDGVLIMPETADRASHLISNKDSTVLWPEFILVYGRTGSYPCLYGRLHSDGRTDGWEVEKGRPARN